MGLELGLGLGLGASTAVISHGNEIIHLPVDKIAPNPYQPRKIFAREQLFELAESIKKYGVMQPVSVRCINGAVYELVAGERRLRASKLAGLATIPAVVVSITDRDSASLALIENLQRENLNYLEEAEGYINLISDYSFTQEQLAAQIGKSQSAIANKLRILRLSPRIHKILLENGLSERHARALLKLDDEDKQLQTLEIVVNKELNVKKTEELVEAIIARDIEIERKTKKKQPQAKPYVKDIRLFTNTIKQAVEIMNDAGVSTIYDIEDRADGCFIGILVSY